MRSVRGVAAFLLAASVLFPLQSGSIPAQSRLDQTHLWIPMHDGVKLAAWLFRRDDASQPAKLPTILIRTPYGKGTQIAPNNQALVDHGYNVIVQDVRGRYESEGKFLPLTQEPQDGDDTINWIAAQPWSNGKVGMTGGSYLGMAAWQAAVLNNPHLKAIFPVVSGDDDYRDRIYSPGGAMKWGHRLEWVAQNMHAPGYQPPDFKQFIWVLPERRADKLVTGMSSHMLNAAFDHPAYDVFWKTIATREKLKTLDVPVFSVGGWYDNYVEGDLDAFTRLHKRGAPCRILIGPWPHNMSVPFKTIDYGQIGALPIRRYLFDWFDEWLKNEKVALRAQPPVKLFVMGANEWRDEENWPLDRAVPSKWYLDSGGRANSSNGDGRLDEFSPAKGHADKFIYDPHTPVPTVGGSVCCNDAVFPWGPMDQRTVEKRNDVLVYSTDPLKEDTEVTGPISLILWASTSAPDTDFTGKLIDVYPDGRAINLTDGIIRARYRDGLEKPKLLKSSEPVKYTVDLGVTANVFKKGHRIRLEISSSNFPRFDRNPNTGRPIADETQLVKASQTVLHDRTHRSYLKLPVVPSSALIGTNRRTAIDPRKI